MLLQTKDVLVLKLEIQIINRHNSFLEVKTLVDNLLKKCPMFGLSVEAFQMIVKEKSELELKEKLKTIENK